MTKQRDPINGLVNQLLTKPPLQTELLADLIADLADSPEAIAELDTLSSALTGEPSTLLAMAQRVRDYQACLDLLSAYVEAELSRGDPTQRYPTVAEHIRTYPRFRQQYEQLLTTLHEDAQGDYGAAPSDLNFAEWHGFTSVEKLQPAPDLPDQRPTEPSAAYWWNELGYFFLRFSAAFLDTIQPPAMQPTYVGVKSSSSAKTLYEFSLEQPEQDLVARITVKAEEEQPEFCSIDVEIEVPSRGGWPHLADIAVTIKRREQVWEEQETNSFGQVTFSHVPVVALPELLFEIIPDP